VKVVLAKIADCPTCQGTSVELVRGPDCLLCAGTGDTGQRGLVGRLLFGEPCPGCSGDGFVKIPRRCSECYGLGHRTTHTDTVMDLVAGIRDGTILPVPNTGCTLRVSVSPDKGFSRDGDNLRISKQLKASNLTKGATLSIRCLDGVKRQARVPPGSADGSQIILHHCGMPRVNSRDIGDLIVTVSAKPDG
jgi:DnaJ-class molecular chaperone